MPPVERDAPASYAERPSSRHARNSTQSLSFDASRALVPMWDSSDPERAPPPLPLNPQSPGTATSRTGTSSAIQLAHAALSEKARENALVPYPLTKRPTDSSPERSLAKGAAHRRMQSLQPASVRDVGYMLEGGQLSKSPEKTDRELPVTPARSKTDPFNDVRSDEQDPEQRASLTPAGVVSLTPVVRPMPRRPQSSILGENTPPQSATMLALQNMSAPKEMPSKRDVDTPLANATNGSMSPTKNPQSIENISGQILTLTNIATALQKEMAQLSRRSRDNATDLLSLKEATNTRDEDIRKNMRDLLHNMQEVSSRTVSSASRDMYGGPLLLENKPYAPASLSPSSRAGSNMRPFALPRIPSPNSFAASLDRDDISTPSLAGTDASATIGLLDKIIRDMSTKDGQEQLMSRLSDLARKLDGFNVEQKVDDLQRLIRTNMDQSLVLAQGGSGAGGGKIGRPRNKSFSDGPNEYRNGSEARVERLIQDNNQSPGTRVAADVISDDIVKIIRTVKDSVAQGGGLTAEVKALVRELRGEVLGMGREIGRKLDEVSETNQSRTAAATSREINRVVEEGLLEMKDHMNQLTRDHLRQSAAAITANRTPEVDYQEIYNALRTALKDSKALEDDAPALHREDVIEAVKDAWENYKPEIEVQQIGLERDEVLACLREGLMQHAPRDDKEPGATREEVYKAVVEGLKHFTPPPIQVPETLSRDEIIEAVRDCLEEFEFPVAASALDADLSKQDMIDAVKQGLENMDVHAKDGAPLVPYQGNSEEIVARLHDIMEYMQSEFKAVSDEAKQNVAANGRDTEQVLDATKDGFEKLRADIEGYVDRATGVASQEEFMEDLLKSLDVFRDEIADMVAKQSDGSKDVIREELESLRDAVNTSMVPASSQPSSVNHDEILQAFQEGIGSLRQEISQRPVAGTNEVLDALQEGLTDLRVSIDKLSDKPADLTANDEILDALRTGLDGVKSDIEELREESKALAPVASDAVVAADVLKHEDIKNLEVLISQLRIKVEAMEPNPVPAAAASETGSSLSKDDIVLMEDMLHNIKEQVAEIASKEPAAATVRDAPVSTDAATKEDVEAIETILRNTKSRLDELMDGEQAVRKDHVDALEVLILETKESLGGLTEQLEKIALREDTQAVESLVTQVIGAFDEMKERHEKQLEDPEKVTKTDTDAIEAVCLDVKGVVEQMVKSDIASLSTKEDLERLESLVKEFKEISDKQATELKEAAEKHAGELKEAAEKHATELKELSEQHAEENAKQFEERQAETVGVSERVTEVKAFLEEMQTLVKEKLETGITGVEGLSKSLETLSETAGQNANVHSDLKEMFETMKTEFEESKAGVVGAKLETDEKFEQTTETLRTKIDERIDEVIAKYEEFQSAIDERNKTGEARDEVLEGAVVGTKAVAEELKSLIDTLGSTVTESLEKMEEASKTVFTHVEDLVLKTDDNHTQNKSEHTQTRDQVKEAMGAFEGLQGQVNEYQPKILEAVQSVLDTVGQHFEHSKASVSEIEEKIGQKIEEAKPEPLMLPPAPEKYDDSHVHEKLDRLVDHTQSADKAFEQLSTLDKVHQQVIATATELSAFLAAQTQRIADDHEDKQKTMKDMESNLHETMLELERRTVQRDEAEATVASLQAEEERLRKSIVSLKVEQESLVRQKVSLTGDVSSLETALNIRREELHEMEHRAEGLERRILEGVMDQSRLLLMAKSSKKAARDVMSRKRVTSQKPAAEDGGAETESKQTTPKAQHTVAFKTALNSNRNVLDPQSALNGQQQARRILSLSQIKKPGFNSTANAGTAFKRSQSVKTLGGAGAFRKGSWGGRMNNKKGYGDLHHSDEGDKENVNLDVVALRESDEEELYNQEDEHHGGEVVLATPTDAAPLASTVSENPSQDYYETYSDVQSETGTLRRSSLHSGTGTITDSEYTHSELQSGEYSPSELQSAAFTNSEGADDEMYSESASDWTESAVGSSVLSGTDSEVSGVGYATSDGGVTPSSEGGEVMLYEG